MPQPRWGVSQLTGVVGDGAKQLRVPAHPVGREQAGHQLGLVVARPIDWTSAPRVSPSMWVARGLCVFPRRPARSGCRDPPAPAQPRTTPLASPSSESRRNPKIMHGMHHLRRETMLQFVKITSDSHHSAGALNYFEFQCIHGLPCRDSAKSSSVYRSGAFPEEARSAGGSSAHRRASGLRASRRAGLACLR